MQAVYAFQIEGNPIEAAVFGHGHINHTIKVKTDAGKDYVLQRINTYVFKDPVHLMENAGAVTKFLAERVDDPRAALHFIPAEEDFYQSAIAFGRFQNLLSDFPAETLYETIPEFHNTIDRYRLFHASIDADVMGRAADVQPEIDFLLEREEEMGLLQRMREAGEIPLRVTHNDTKLNNVLLDKNTRKCLCVLDLDTVMPGLSVYDFGDSIRFGAATAAEDEFDLSKMSLDLRLFEVYTMGFLEACPSLTETEVEMLAVGAKTMTLECAMRFLTDYLDGDKYFGVQYPQHNLVRARSQLKLVKDMEKKWDKMNEIVAQVAKQTRRG